MNTTKYKDIMNAEYPFELHHARMSMTDRAAQFAPFKAVTGHEDAIEETARLTEEKITLDVTAIEKINERLSYIAEHLEEKFSVVITYFKPDSRKEGGAYLTDIGVIKKIDAVEHLVIMESGMKINMEHIVGVEVE